MEEPAPFNPAQHQEQPFGSPPFGQQPTMRPKNWLIESILVTIFCCLPFGIAGIVNASNVNSKYDAGDYAGAMRASQEAGKWTKIGFFVGIAWVVIWMVYVFLVVGISAFNM